MTDFSELSWVQSHAAMTPGAKEDEERA
jgi:hypothetical protein